MADNEDQQPVNGTDAGEGEEQGEATAEQNANENQSAEDMNQATTNDADAEEGQAEAGADAEAEGIAEEQDKGEEEQNDEEKEGGEDADASENVGTDAVTGQEEAQAQEEDGDQQDEETGETQEAADNEDEEQQQYDEDRQEQEESAQEEEAGDIQEQKEGEEEEIVDQEEEQTKSSQMEEVQEEDDLKMEKEEQETEEQQQETEEQETKEQQQEMEEEKEETEVQEQETEGHESKAQQETEEQGEETVVDEGAQQTAVGDSTAAEEEEERGITEEDQEEMQNEAHGGGDKDGIEEGNEEDEQTDEQQALISEQEDEGDKFEGKADAEQQEEETEGTQVTEAQEDGEKEAEETTEEETGGQTEATPGSDDKEDDAEDQAEEKVITEGGEAVGGAEAADEQQEEGAEQAQAEGGEMPFDIEQSEATMLKEQSDIDESANAAASQDGAGVPPAPHLPSNERSYTNIEGQMSTSALNIVWSFGLNRNVPVLNLSDGVRNAIMYPCAHVGIMYDFKNNKQHSLQAHLNPITCSAVSQDKRWLVTGDVGPDAMVNIWDTYTGTPIQTMFDPNPQGGVVAVALTPDSRYLATLSALPTQTLAIWDWTVDGDVPICSADLKPEFGVQNYIHFDPTDIHHLVTNSETQVLFYNWEDNHIKYFAPPLSDSDFNKPVGRYSQSLFQIGIARALTATSIGNLVVWDNNRPLSKIMDVNQSADKKPLKIIKVHDKGINVLTTTDSYIVIGDTGGHVKFFDQGLRLIYWYQDFHSGPVTAISFAHIPDFVPVATEGSKYPNDVTKQAKPFVVRDFIVGTGIAVYCSINTDGSKLKIIHREHDAAVHALDAHPRLPVIAMGSYSGLLKLWDYRAKEVVASRMFEKSHIQCVAFDPKGFYLAVGCTNGTVYLVDSIALLNQLSDPFKYARDAITHIAFSHNSLYFATADAGFTITVYKRQRKEGRNPYVWHGRYRSHYKPIRDLLFDVHLDTNEPKLLSLGEDRMLIEYDLNYVGKTHNHVVPCAEDRIEQGAIPQCMTKYPPITQEHFFLTANDQFKLKCYNSTTKMCRKTVLGPTYGSPIRKMIVVPGAEDDKKRRFMAYITDDKVGLHILPATGNPHLAMALIAHPSGVSNLTCSFDGAYLFTAGGPDFAVHMWEINIAALEAQCKLGGEDLVPFYGLLEGGRDGELFAELEDLFYYAQLRHQGINSMDRREIGNRVPLTEVPFIMRAMGFYPSEQEIEDMINEIKYDEYVSSGQYQEDIDLGRFIKLYVNHRPAFGLSPEKLLWAFQTLAENPELGKGGVMERGDLLDILQKNGEHMTEYELAEHLTTLLGFNQEGGSCEQEPFEADKAGSYIADALPYDINAEILINEILGFSMTVDPPAPDDTKQVIKSTAS